MHISLVTGEAAEFHAKLFEFAFGKYPQSRTNRCDAAGAQLQN